MSDETENGNPLDALAEEFVARFRRGERPALTEFTSRHPELAKDIRDLFPALVMMEEVRPDDESPMTDALETSGPRTPTGRRLERLGDYRILREIGRGGMGIVYEAEQESLGRHVALKVLPAHAMLDPRHSQRFQREARAAAGLHHTNIVPVFGVGVQDGLNYFVMQFIPGLGLDEVLIELSRLRKAKNKRTAMAVPTSTPTPSAVRIAETLLSGAVGSAVEPTPLNRTSLETSAVEESDMLVPEQSQYADTSAVYLPGQSANSTLSEFGRAYWQSIARIGVQVADALAYANRQGVIHRDIKPSNLLLDTQGVVWITDFGLAKLTDSDDLTHTGDIVGTLRYLAPERLQGKSDVRSDIYGLGTTLYEMLTLRATFEYSDRNQLIQKISQVEPPSPRSIDPTIPLDLETIVLKAIAKDPSDRYPSADELAEDLRRFLTDRPIAARRTSPVEQAWRWCRRNKAVASLLTTVAVLLVSVAIGASLMAVQFRFERNRADKARDEAVAEKRQGRLNEAEAMVGEAHGTRYSRREGQRFATLAALKKAADIGRELEKPPKWFDRLRNEAIAALALPDIHITKTWPGWPEGTVCAAVSGDFLVYARSNEAGAISVRRLEDDAELARIPGTGVRCDIALSSDGTHLVQLSGKGDFDPTNRIARLWKLNAKEPHELLSVPQVRSPTFLDMPEGRRLVFIDDRGAIGVYDVITGQKIGFFEPMTVTNKARIAAHPQKPLVAVSSYLQNVVVLRDIRTGAVVSQVTPPWTGGSGAAWHPSGRFLCVIDANQGIVRVNHFEPSTGSVTYWRTISGFDGDAILAFSPAGDRMYSSGWTSELTLWDFWTGQQLFAPKSSFLAGGYPAKPFVNGDAKQVGLAMIREKSGQVGIWSVADSRECRTIVGSSVAKPNTSGNFALHPGGQIIAHGYVDGIRLFDLDTGNELGLITNLFPSGSLTESRVFFDGLGNLYTNSFAGAFRWHVTPDSERPNLWRIGPPTRLPFHPGTQTISASADGKVVAQAMYNGYGMEPYAGGWVLHPQSPRPHWIEKGTSGTVTYVSPDGRWVTFQHVYDAATGKMIWPTPTGTIIRGFSKDGHWLFSTGSRNSVHAVGDWSPGPDLGPGFLRACTPDNLMGVFVVGNSSYRLADMKRGQEFARLEDPDQYIREAVFNADGTKLIAEVPNGLRVWDLRLIRQELVKLGLDWDAPPYPPVKADSISLGPIEVEVIGADLLANPRSADLDVNSIPESH